MKVFMVAVINIEEREERVSWGESITGKQPHFHCPLSVRIKPEKGAQKI